MNHKGLIIVKIKEFSQRHPEFSIGAILYSAMSLKYKGTEFTKGALFEISDEDLYGLLTKAQIAEDIDKMEAMNQE